MFRKLKRLLLPNPFDSQLKKCAKRGGKKILLGWNRGLGDIALGLYAMIQRIREKIPGAEITFLTRPNLQEGFSLLRDIHVLIDPDLKRGQCWDVLFSLKKMGIDPKSFDLIIGKPSPTDWVSWQRGKVTPLLEWDPSFENLWQKFGLQEGFTYIGVQVVVETNYGPWRNWPINHWKFLFARLEKLKNVKVILLGGDEKTEFQGGNILDLRGKTTLFELLSIATKCSHMILPDSGILSMVYYLNYQFPIHLISLWGDPNHGILKQAVRSPNLALKHTPLIGALRDLSTVTVDTMMNTLFPAKPLKTCLKSTEVVCGTPANTGCILLAGGQGTRLKVKGPKGTFALEGKSLFEWVVEKAPFDHFPIAVMTSPINHEETVSFFEKNGNFGREVYFFQQEMLPFLDKKKKPLKTLAPSGNGSVFRSFVQSGLYDLFQKKGIDLLTIVPVENPLADPADLSLIGYARQMKSDVTIKCVERKSPNEAMGALVEREGRIEIVEYIDQDPSFEYTYGNTGMMAMNMPFFYEMSKVDLPLHCVEKTIPGTKKLGWKREMFIFDVFCFGKVSALCYDKKSCYAPIKSLASIRE